MIISWANITVIIVGAASDDGAFDDGVSAQVVETEARARREGVERVREVGTCIPVVDAGVGVGGGDCCCRVLAGEMMTAFVPAPTAVAVMMVMDE